MVIGTRLSREQDAMLELHERAEKAEAEVARLREALKTLFEARGLSFNAVGEASCNWCGAWDKNGLGAECLEHLPGCPFAPLNKGADDDPNR